jgi:hypothetical protein
LSDLLLQPATDSPTSAVAAVKAATATTGVFINALLCRVARPSGHWCGTSAGLLEP